MPSCIRTLFLILLPLLNPLLDSLNIRLDVVRVLAFQFDYNLLLVALARFFEQYLHDLAVHVLLQLSILVATRGQAIVQDGGIAAKHDDEVDPALGKELAGMKIED